ncbi:MAG: hypothetical protein BWY39_01962 [Spirochaetes bacterium ADurb.Bin269]|nr:MAG: hypothetical protein BWY39_01962 [Spirochaetes bacterium ADurb.Bin269]
MVVYHIEVHFQPFVVKSFHHFLEFPRRAAEALVRGIPAIGREVAEGHIAPEVPPGTVVGIGVVIGFMHRQKLDCRYAERFQIRSHHGGSAIRSAVRIRNGWNTFKALDSIQN